jgi:hypothetical protein
VTKIYFATKRFRISVYLSAFLLSMSSCIRPSISTTSVASFIASRQSLEEFSFYKLDIARGGSDLARLELVASRACCHSEEYIASDQVLRGLLGSGCNQLRSGGRSQHNA